VEQGNAVGCCQVVNNDPRSHSCMHMKDHACLWIYLHTFGLLQGACVLSSVFNPTVMTTMQLEACRYVVEEMPSTVMLTYLLTRSYLSLLTSYSRIKRRHHLEIHEETNKFTSRETLSLDSGSALPLEGMFNPTATMCPCPCPVCKIFHISFINKRPIIR
jgi:hypothetical protein